MMTMMMTITGLLSAISDSDLSGHFKILNFVAENLFFLTKRNTYQAVRTAYTTITTVCAL